MANFADLTAKLNLNIQNFSTNLKKASGMMTKFSKDMNGTMNTGVTQPAKKAYTALTDVKRIVQGILISQVFYSGLRSIKAATAATWDFTSRLEYAKIAYSNLFGNSSLATEFTNVLKDFSAVTPFDFSDSEAAAKRLLAYGIQYKNVMYVMKGIMAASTMSGDAQTIESVSRALGQINTKGRLYGEEMRQLTEAGIPAYEILREKLGLTNDQLKNLAKNAIPANVAINALVDGINERFGSVAAVSNMTMQGLFSNLKDNLLMIGSDAIQPLFDRVKALLVPFVAFVTELRNVAETGNMGSIFEHLIPENMQSMLRVFIANLMNLWTVAKIYLADAFKLLKIILYDLVKVFNAFAPSVTATLDVIARLIKVILDNKTAVQYLTAALATAAAMWVVFKLKAIATAVVTTVINGIAVSVAFLAKMLTFVVAHPFWSLLLGLIGTVVGLSTGFGSLGESVSSFFKKLTQFNGINPDKLLLPSQKERAADLDKFNKRLTGTGDAMDNLADSTGKAVKAAKGLLSFDEVFKLNQPDEGTNAGINTPDDFSLPTMDTSGINLLPEIPSFSGFARDFIDSLAKALGGEKEALSTALGGLIGAAIGGIIGGPAGAVIGLALGALAGWLWPKITKALNITNVGEVAIPISTGIGAAIGFAFGGPGGAFIGAAIGAAVGFLIDGFARGIENGDWSQVGVMLGGVLGWAVKLIADNWSTITDEYKNIGPWFSNLFGVIVGWFKKIGGSNSDFFGSLRGSITGFFTDLKNWFGSVWEAVSTFFTNIYSTISTTASTLFGPLIDALQNLFRFIGGVMSDIWTAITTVWNDIANTVTTVTSRIWQTISEIFSLIRDICVKVFTDIFLAVSTRLNNIWTAISNWFAPVSTIISTGLTAILDIFSRIFNGILEKVAYYLGLVSNTLTGLFTTTTTKCTEWHDSMLSKISSFFGTIWDKVVDIFTKVASKISEQFGQIVLAISTFVGNVLNGFTKFFTDAWDNVKTGTANIYNTFKDWIKNLWDNVFGKFFGWIDDGIAKLREFFGLKDTAKETDASYSGPQPTLAGHATGGIFSREHVARFAEGNKAEAVIPLENADAMTPFVNAISDGIMQGLLPTLAAVTANNSVGNTEALRPLYVGTLVADERSLKELQRKMNVITLSDNKRRGI